MKESRQHSQRTFYYTAAAIVLVLAAIALPFARHYYTQRTLIGEVEGFGGSVVMEPGEPKWLRDRLPRGLTPCLDTPREVHLDNSTVNDAWLANLREHPTIEFLGLADTNITNTGAAHLHDMPHVQVLWLSGTRITDEGLSSLRGFPELVLLYVDGTRVTAAGVATARSRLSHTDVQW